MMKGLTLAWLSGSLLLAGCETKTSSSGAPDAARPSASVVVAASGSARAPTPVLGDVDGGAATATEETPAGPIAIVEGEAFRQKLTLKGQTIYPATRCAGDDPACPKLQEVSSTFERLTKLQSFTPAGSKDKVVLFQSGTMGNACNGGPLFFVRFRPDGSFRASEPIDHCGGPDPKITRTGEVVRLLVPAHPPNRGTGTISEAASEYDLATDKLKKTK